MKKLILLFVILVFVSSCGVKGDLSKPEGVKYRRTYPKY